MDNYIPFLKLKSNEILAIKELEEELKDEITPFFDFPRRDVLTEDTFKKTTEKMVRSVRKHLYNISYFYLDNFDIDSNLKIDGIYNYAYLLESYSDFPVIPVVSIDRSDDHINAVCDAKNSGLIDSEVFALRLAPEDFENFDVVTDDINEMIGDVFETFDNMDLIFDCRVCLNQNLDTLALNIINFAQKFSESYSIRKLIVTGSSIPPSIADVTGTESEVELHRAELRVFYLVNMELGKLFNMILGDYGIVSPNYSELGIMPEAMQNVTAPKILYAFNNYQYFIRGGALKTHPRGFAQYYDLAEILVAKDFYRGENYSFGDRFLKEKSYGTGSNVTPSIIIKPTVNAHITFMLKGYANDSA